MTPPNLPARPAIVFPGQGSQHPGMVEPWLAHPSGAEIFEAASAATGFDLIEASHDPERVQQTDVAQPLVFACDIAAYRVLHQHGVRPVAVAGHSLGEFAALVAAGVLTFEDALHVVRERSRAMAEACRISPGAMTALVGLQPRDAAEVCEIAGRGDVLVVANENGPAQTVVSGSTAAIELAEALGRDRGARPVRLRVAGAFHSPLMRPALARVRARLARLPFPDAEIPVIPNARGKPETRGPVLRDLLSRQILAPVRWRDTMLSLEALGADTVIEAGPGDVLTRLARRTVPNLRAIAVNDPASASEVAATLAQGAVR